jgi:signal transduction histidine kinase
MNKVSAKLVLLLILSALVPMTLFGIIAIWNARDASRKIVAEENLQVANRAAHQIEQQVNNSTAILEALAQNLAKTDLLRWQKERMVRNYTLQFERFRSIDLVDKTGRLQVSSRLDLIKEDQPQEAAIHAALAGRIYRSGVFISQNFEPSMTVAIPVRVLGEVQGAVVGQINLIQMWKLVDSIRIGREGHAFVVSKEGLLIAHGLNSAKERVFKQEQVGGLPIVDAALRGEMQSLVYRNQEGEEQIGVSAPVESLGWGLVIEQPTREAYAASTRLTYQLTILVLVFLFLMILIGMVGGRRSVVAPIQELIRGIREVGGGNLAKKVKILTRDEFREVGEAFNTMTERLSVLEENIRRNERAVLMGRIASGLVHDLKHPIESIGNSSRLMIQKYDDPKMREVYEAVMKRELANLSRFLENLGHLSRPTQIQPVAIGLSSFFGDFLEAFRVDPRCRVEKEGEAPVDQVTDGKVRISVNLDSPDIKIWADRFALERVLKNLITNAIEAMPHGGRLVIGARTVPPNITEISVSDSGSGIPPDRLDNLFEDYITTKRKGLGLGLATCKKMVEEHKATVRVQSHPGKGTTFILQFPHP